MEHLASIPRRRIETERLYLRPYQEEDQTWYFSMSLKNKAHLAVYETLNPVRSIITEEDAARVIQSFLAAWEARASFFLGVFEKETHEFVGQIYIGTVDWALPEFEAGYFVEVSHEGQGYIREALGAAFGFIFGDLKAERVRLECDDTNTRSSHVAESCGMVKEGHFRQNKRHADGHLSGTLWYGLLREEYEQRIKR